MNFSLAREIYGNSPWMVDAISFPGLFGILNDFRNGVKLDYDKDNKLNSLYALDIKSKTRLMFNEFQLRRAQDDDEIISVIKLDGPITKNGGMSSFGMKELSNQMSKMTKDSRVKGTIIVTDSGGGASNAVIFMSDAIKESQAVGKPVIQFIEKGGLNASAAFYIGSFSNFIFSESEDNLVGSIGTMIEFAAFPKKHTDQDGAVHVRVYATASIHKNGDFEEALKGNLKPIINNILDPHNEKFMRQVKENRPNVTEEHLSGKIFEAKDVIGTLIDAIGTMDDAVNKVLELSAANITLNAVQQIEQKAQVPEINNNLNNQEMNLKQFKSEHGSVYEEVFALGSESGIKLEKDRTGAWLAHSDTDIDAVKEGIKSGERISDTKREEFIIKKSSLTHLENLKTDSKGKIKTEQTSSDKELSADEKEVAAYEKELDKKLNIKTA